MIPSTQIPGIFPRGTTVKFTQGFSDYPANDGWTAKLFMVGATARLNNGTGVAGVANGASFDFSLAPADTDLAPGDYRWEIRAYKAADEYVAAYGKTVVMPSLENAAIGSALSKAEIELAAVEAEITIRYADDVQEYGMQGRSMVKIPIEQLVKSREALREQVWREKNPGRIGPSILTVFTRPQ